MKKILSLVLALALSLGLAAPATADKSTLTTADEFEIKTVVEGYLKECAETIFLAEKHDYARNTLTDAIMKKSNRATALPQQIADSRERNCLELMRAIDFEPVKTEDFLDNLHLQNTRIKYLRGLHELYNITYKQFSANYTFEKVVVDEDYAVVSVCESLDYQYSDSNNQSGEQTMFNISLVKQDGKWIILEVICDDMLFLTNYKDSSDLEEEARRLNAGTVQLTDAVGVEIEDTAVPFAVGNIAYNRDNAVNYALTYLAPADDGTGSAKPTWANDNMPWFSANCMNYVSQCIWAGFGGSNSSTDIANFYGMDTEGTSAAHKWYANKTTSSTSWRSCAAFRTYISDFESGKVDMGCTTQEIASNSDSLVYTANALKGAAIQGKGLDNDGNSVALGHVVFVTDATGSTRNSVFVSGYNNNIRNKKLALVYPKTSTAREIDRLFLIIPGHMKNADTGFRVWANLCAPLSVGDAIPIQAYGSAQCKSILLRIYDASGASALVKNFSGASSISTSYTCTTSGLWKIVIMGTDDSNTTKTFTYTVRIQ